MIAGTTEPETHRPSPARIFLRSACAVLAAVWTLAAFALLRFDATPEGGLAGAAVIVDVACAVGDAWLTRRPAAVQRCAMALVGAVNLCAAFFVGRLVMDFAAYLGGTS
jgi:hypothetical protein